MSVKSHKQTRQPNFGQLGPNWPSIVMSALPPKADIRDCDRMSAKCHKGTFRYSLDHLFGRKKKEATMLKTVVLAMGLMAIPSIAQTQQQQCQLECTWVNGKGEKTRVSRSCHGLNASDCVNLGRAETGGNKTCRGYITSECVQDR